jgi:mono/diheme cytochrome c family protein
MRPEYLIRTPEMADLIGVGLDRTVLSLRPFLSESRFGKNLPVTMLGHGVRLTISSLALCVASSAGAQGDLDQSKTAAQLYASNCATCHESPASVKNTKSFSEFESFLRQHYTSNRESAANLVAYLKGQERMSVESQRRRGAMSEVRPPEPTPSASEEDIPRPPADIPEVPPSALGASLSHVVDTGVKPHRRASSATPQPRLKPAEPAPAPAAPNKPASVQIND